MLLLWAVAPLFLQVTDGALETRSRKNWNQLYREIMKDRKLGALQPSALSANVSPYAFQNHDLVSLQQALENESNLYYHNPANSQQFKTENYGNAHTTGGDYGMFPKAMEYEPNLYYHNPVNNQPTETPNLYYHNPVNNQPTETPNLYYHNPLNNQPTETPNLYYHNPLNNQPTETGNANHEYAIGGDYGMIPKALDYESNLYYHNPVNNAPTEAGNADHEYTINGDYGMIPKAMEYESNLNYNNPVNNERTAPLHAQNAVGGDYGMIPKGLEYESNIYYHNPVNNEGTAPGNAPNTIGGDYEMIPKAVEYESNLNYHNPVNKERTAALPVHAQNAMRGDYGIIPMKTHKSPRKPLANKNAFIPGSLNRNVNASDPKEYSPKDELINYRYYNADRTPKGLSNNAHQGDFISKNAWVPESKRPTAPAIDPYAFTDKYGDLDSTHKTVETQYSDVAKSKFDPNVDAANDYDNHPEKIDAYNVNPKQNQPSLPLEYYITPAAWRVPFNNNIASATNDYSVPGFNLEQLSGYQPSDYAHTAQSTYSPFPGYGLQSTGISSFMPFSNRRPYSPTEYNITPGSLSKGVSRVNSDAQQPYKVEEQYPSTDYDAQGSLPEPSIRDMDAEYSDVGQSTSDAEPYALNKGSYIIADYNGSPSFYTPNNYPQYENQPFLTETIPLNFNTDSVNNAEYENINAPSQRNHQDEIKLPNGSPKQLRKGKRVNYSLQPIGISDRKVQSVDRRRPSNKFSPPVFSELQQEAKITKRLLNWAKQRNKHVLPKQNNREFSKNARASRPGGSQRLRRPANRRRISTDYGKGRTPLYGLNNKQIYSGWKTAVQPQFRSVLSSKIKNKLHRFFPSVDLNEPLDKDFTSSKRVPHLQKVPLRSKDHFPKMDFGSSESEDIGSEKETRKNILPQSRSRPATSHHKEKVISKSYAMSSSELDGNKTSVVDANKAVKENIKLDDGDKVHVMSAEDLTMFKSRPFQKGAPTFEDAIDDFNLFDTEDNLNTKGKARNTDKKKKQNKQSGLKNFKSLLSGKMPAGHDVDSPDLDIHVDDIFTDYESQTQKTHDQSSQIKNAINPAQKISAFSLRDRTVSKFNEPDTMSGEFLSDTSADNNEQDISDAAAEDEANDEITYSDSGLDPDQKYQVSENTPPESEDALVFNNEEDGGAKISTLNADLETPFFEGYSPGFEQPEIDVEEDQEFPESLDYNSDYDEDSDEEIDHPDSELLEETDGQQGMMIAPMWSDFQVGSPLNFGGFGLGGLSVAPFFQQEPPSFAYTMNAYTMNPQVNSIDPSAFYPANSFSTDTSGTFLPINIPKIISMDNEMPLPKVQYSTYNTGIGSNYNYNKFPSYEPKIFKVPFYSMSPWSATPSQQPPVISSLKQPPLSPHGFVPKSTFMSSYHAPWYTRNFADDGTPRPITLDNSNLFPTALSGERHWRYPGYRLVKLRETPMDTIRMFDVSKADPLHKVEGAEEANLRTLVLTQPTEGQPRPVPTNAIIRLTRSWY